jgi:hypothetical protein
MLGDWIGVALRLPFVLPGGLLPQAGARLRLGVGFAGRRDGPVSMMSSAGVTLSKPGKRSVHVSAAEAHQRCVLDYRC